MSYFFMVFVILSINILRFPFSRKKFILCEDTSYTTYSLDGVAKRVFKLLMLSNTTVFVKKLKSKIKAIAFLLMALKIPFLRYKSTIRS